MRTIRDESLMIQLLVYLAVLIPHVPVAIIVTIAEPTITKNPGALLLKFSEVRAVAIRNSS